MEAAEIYYYQNKSSDNVVGEEEELMNDFIVKSGILEFDDSDSEDEDYTSLRQEDSTIMDKRHLNLAMKSTSGSHTERVVNENNTDSEFENNDHSEERPQIVIDSKSTERKRKKSERNKRYWAKIKLLDDENSTAEKKRKHAESQRRYRNRKKALAIQKAMKMRETDKKNEQSKKYIDQDMETHRKKLAAIRAKNYRDRNAARKITIADENSQEPEFSSKDAPQDKRIIHSSQIAGPSHKQVPFFQTNPLHDSQIAGPPTKEVPMLPKEEYHDLTEREDINVHSEETEPLESVEHKPEICDEVILPDSDSTIEHLSNPSKVDDSCRPIKVLEISKIGNNEHSIAGNSESNLKTEDPSMYHRISDDELSTSINNNVKSEPLDEDDDNFSENYDIQNIKTDISFKQEPLDYDIAVEETSVQNRREVTPAFIDNEMCGVESNHGIEPTPTSTRDGNLLRQRLQRIPSNNKTGNHSKISKVRCREVGEVKEKPDYLFKIDSVDMKGLNIHYKCYKCGEVLREYTTILFVHQCTLNVNSYPTLQCFYCRQVSIINVEYIKNHFSGILDDYRKNKTVSYYRCFFDQCQFVSPSSSCLSLHIKAAHPESSCILQNKRDVGFDQFLNCPFCQHKFRHELLLKRHVIAFHPSTTTKPTNYKYTCDICGFKAVFLSSLKVHLNFAHKKVLDKNTDFSKFLIMK